MEREPAISPRHADTDQGRRSALVVRSRPFDEPQDFGSARGSERPRRRTSPTIRQRPRSRARFVVTDDVLSSSEDDRRTRNRARSEGATKIRATSRPGERNEYALVRKPSRGRRKSVSKQAIIHDLELKTDPRYRKFKDRRDVLENVEGSALRRARSRGRDSFSDEESERLSYYDQASIRSPHHGDHVDYRGNVDQGRREAIILGADKGPDGGGRFVREPKKHRHGAILLDKERNPHASSHIPGRRRSSLSPHSHRLSIDGRSDLVAVPRKSPAFYDDQGLETGSRRVISPREAQYRAEKERRAIDREQDLIERGNQRRVNERDRDILLADNRRAQEQNAIAREEELRIEDRERGKLAREARAIDRERAILEKERAWDDHSRRTMPLEEKRYIDDRASTRGSVISENERYIDDRSSGRKHAPLEPERLLLDDRMSARGSVVPERGRYIDDRDRAVAPEKSARRDGDQGGLLSGLKKGQQVVNEGRKIYQTGMGLFGPH